MLNFLLALVVVVAVVIFFGLLAFIGNTLDKLNSAVFILIEEIKKRRNEPYV